MKHQWRFQLILNRNQVEISMEYQWKSIGSPVGIELKYHLDYLYYNADKYLKLEVGGFCIVHNANNADTMSDVASIRRLALCPIPKMLTPCLTWQVLEDWHCEKCQ